MVIARGKATLEQCQTVYSAGDVLDMLDTIEWFDELESDAHERAEREAGRR